MSFRPSAADVTALAALATRPGAIGLSLGGLTGCFGCPVLPGGFVAQLRERYAAFLVPDAASPANDPPTFALALDFIATADAQAREQQMIDRPLVVTTELDQVGQIDQIDINRWDLSASLALGADGVWRGSARCEMNPHSFDTLLRVIWSVLLPRHGGCLLHACGVRDGDHALVFPGVSEQGKTTLARKVPDPDDVLSDELVILRANGAGEWCAYGTPFWGDFARGGISRHGLPLAAIALLVQAPALAVTPLQTAAAALRLLECWLGFEADAGAAQRNLALAIRLCREARVVEVRTRRETPVSEILQQLLAPTTPVLGPLPHPAAPVIAR